MEPHEQPGLSLPRNDRLQRWPKAHLTAGQGRAAQFVWASIHYEGREDGRSLALGGGRETHYHALVGAALFLSRRRGVLFGTIDVFRWKARAFALWREAKVASEPAALLAWFGGLGISLARIGLERVKLSAIGMME